MTSTQDTQNTTLPSFGVALAYWAKLGVISFGGPAGQIAIMQQDLVDRLKWVRHLDFMNALNICMLLPGPEAQQLATYLGWRMHGLKGALAAGVLFVAPGAAVLLALSWVAAAHGDVTWIARAFSGLMPVVVAIVAGALWRTARRALRSTIAVAVAIAVFVAVGVFGLPFPAVVALAAAIGLAAAQAGRGGWFAALGHGHAAPVEAERGLALDWRRLAGIAAIYAFAIGTPTWALWALTDSNHFPVLAWLFSKAAFVTFGGAYAVLPYVADAAVNDLGWLSREAMMNGMALAETTPGPLILVLQYVGFFSGWNAAAAQLAAGWPRESLAAVSALFATYATFLPSICLILTIAPAVGAIGAMPRVSAALGAITAAVVGMIGTLAIFLAETAFISDGKVLIVRSVVAVAALVAILRWNIAVHWLVMAGAALGLIGVTA